MKNDDTFENSINYYKDIPSYNKLRSKLFELAFDNFLKAKGEFCSTFKVGLHKFPIGYVGVRTIVDSGDLEEGGYRFFWIDSDGNQSEHFKGKWDVYNNAKLNLPWKKQMTDDEKELIQKYDPHFGVKNKPKTASSFIMESNFHKQS